jgi:hypothetical protein
MPDHLYDHGKKCGKGEEEKKLFSLKWLCHAYIACRTFYTDDLSVLHAESVECVVKLLTKSVIIL